MSNVISVNVVADVRNISNGIRDVNSKLDGMNGSASKVMGGLKKMALAAGGAFAATKVVDFLKDSVAAGRESNKVMAQTNAVLKSTGGVAGVTAKGVGALADSIAAKTGVDDEAIASAQNLLLTFTSVKNGVGKGNKVFNDATQTIVDMNASLGKGPGGLSSTTTMVGKALQDPIKGISALSKVGVNFTDQQKKQIKTMVESGDTMGAQKMILQELNKEYGGSAAAQGTAWDKLKVQLGNIQEAIGQKLIPLLDKLAAYISKNLPSWLETASKAFKSLKGAVSAVWDVLGPVLGFIADHATVFSVLAGTILTVVAGFKLWSAATKAYTAIQAALNVVMDANPIGLVIIAIAALVAGIIIAYKKSDTFRQIVDTAFRAIGAAGKWLWNNALKPAFDAISKAFSALGTAVNFMWTKVIQPVFKFIISAWLTVVGAIIHGAASAFGWVPGVGPKLKAAAKEFDKLRSSVESKLNGMGAAGERFGADFARGLARGISRNAHVPMGAATVVASKVSAMMRAGFDSHSPSRVAAKIGEFVSIGLAVGIKSAASQAVKQAKSLTTSVNAALSDVGAPTDVINFGMGPVPVLAGGASSSSANINTYNITVNTLDSRTAGKVVVDALNDYERKNGGRRV